MRHPAARDIDGILVRHARRVTRMRAIASRLPDAIRRSYRIRAMLARLARLTPRYLDGDEPITMRGGSGDTTADAPHILLVTHELSSSGAPRIVAELARIFAEDGWSVTVASPSDGPIADAVLPHARLLIDPTVLSADSPALRDLIPAVDVAVVNTVVGAGAVIACARAVPVLWYIHEVSLLKAMIARDPATTAAAHAASRVFCGSELPASIIRPLRPDVQVLPYGVARLGVDGADTARTAMAGTRVGVFAAIEPRKGQDLAVAALGHVPAALRDTIDLKLYGRRLDAAFAGRVDAALGDCPQARWGGELDAAGYAAAMAATDIVLVSSRDDTLPLVSLDALGIGRILICTATTGTSAWLTDGVSGFVADRADAEAIGAALTRALTRRADWSTIRAAATKTFDTEFSEQVFALAVRAAARSAIAGHAR